AVVRDAADSHPGVSPRSQERGTVRAPRRSRRGHPGVALPPREDGRADDRNKARHRRIARRRIPARDGWTPALSRPLGHSLRLVIRNLEYLEFGIRVALSGSG